MRIFGIILGLLVAGLGLRLIFSAGQTFLTGRVLVRRGLQTQWEPASNQQEAMQVALKSGVMGVLLVILGVALIT